MARTYIAPRKLHVSGKAGKKKVVKYFDIPEVDLALHHIIQKKKLTKQRKRDRQWKLAAAAAANPRLLIGK